MKNYHLNNLLKSDLLIVELPRLSNYTLGSRGLFVEDLETKETHVFKDSYILLGKPDEISEDDAVELVHEDDGEFADYKHDANWFPTATESLLSAIESVIFWDVNPEPKKDYFDTFGKRESLPTDKFEKDLIAWHEAESRTFDRNRTLIFVKQ